MAIVTRAEGVECPRCWKFHKWSISPWRLCADCVDVLIDMADSGFASTLQGLKVARSQEPILRLFITSLYDYCHQNNLTPLPADLSRIPSFPQVDNMVENWKNPE